MSETSATESKRRRSSTCDDARGRPLTQQILDPSALRFVQGCNAFGSRADERAVGEIVEATLAAEVVAFDTADVYASGESERQLGAALAGRRAGALVATKFGLGLRGAGPASGRREYVRAAAFASMERLRSDYIDLYQMHVPDPSTPIAETVGALEELRREGWIRAFGSSNFDPSALHETARAAVALGSPAFATTQGEYSVLVRDAEAELIPAADGLGVSFLAYRPLANGLLTGKYDSLAPREGQLAFRSDRARAVLTPENLARVAELRRLATLWGCSLPAIALGSVAARDGVAGVVVGASTAAQVRENVAAVRWRPDREQARAIEAVWARRAAVDG